MSPLYFPHVPRFDIIQVIFLLFHRALTEKIVAVLPKMKCPHRIEPHQIQGLDFIHIYPVVQVILNVINLIECCYGHLFITLIDELGQKT